MLQYIVVYKWLHGSGFLTGGRRMRLGPAAGSDLGPMAGDGTGFTCSRPSSLHLSPTSYLGTWKSLAQRAFGTWAKMQ